MNIKVISQSKGNKSHGTDAEAQIITIEETTYGDVRTTRHVWLKKGIWRDKKGNRYDIR